MDQPLNTGALKQCLEVGFLKPSSSLALSLPFKSVLMVAIKVKHALK